MHRALERAAVGQAGEPVPGRLLLPEPVLPRAPGVRRRAPDQVADPLLDLVREVLPPRRPDRHHADPLTRDLHRNEDRRPERAAPVTLGRAERRLVRFLERSPGAEHRRERAVVRGHGTEQAIVRLAREAHDRELVADPHRDDDFGAREFLQQECQLAPHALDRLDVRFPAVGRRQRGHPRPALQSLEQAIQFILECRHRMRRGSRRQQGRRREAGAAAHHENPCFEPLDQRAILGARAVESHLGGEEGVVRRRRRRHPARHLARQVAPLRLHGPAPPSRPARPGATPAPGRAAGGSPRHRRPRRRHGWHGGARTTRWRCR